ncbi:MAG: hypothetical protein ACYDBL_05045 [Candidatus Acidiferrales bacterium]
MNLPKPRRASYFPTQSNLPPISFWFGRVLLLLCCLALFAGASFAQQDSLVGRLPADTWLYLHWRGTASLTRFRNTNSVLRLWNDPSFVGARQNLINRVTQEAKQKNPKSNGLTREQSDEIFSLLENEAAFGFISRAGVAPAGASKSASSFLIYDATGKQDILDKFNAQRAKDSASTFTRTPLPVGSFTAYKIVNGKSISYEAQAGRYFVRTDTLAAMEEILPRITAAHPPAARFEEAAAVPSACRNSAAGSLLNFLALPAKFNLAAIPPSPAFNFPAFIKTLHLDQVHTVCGNVTFESRVTRMHGAVLGDTSAGSILNIIGEGRSSFSTLALAPSGASYECSVLDFLALYKTLLAGFTAALPPDKQGFIAGIDSLVSTFWGMPPADALGLFTGEFATIRVDPAADPTRAIYAFTIQHPRKVATLLQHLIPGASATQNQNGDTTYVTITFPQHAQASQTPPPPPQPSVFFFAVTPSMVIAAKHQDLVRDAVARLRVPPGSAQSNSLSNDPGFKNARAAMPLKLTSLAYADLTVFNWTNLLNNFQKQINDQTQAAARKAGKPAPPPVDLLQGFDPKTISKYLHTSSSSAWKNSTGIYFESAIQ